MTPDVDVTGEGSVYIVTPISEEAQAWTDENVSEDRTPYAGGFAVEHRYISDLVGGMLTDGLTVHLNGYELTLGPN